MSISTSFAVATFDWSVPVCLPACQVAPILLIAFAPILAIRNTQLRVLIRSHRNRMRKINKRPNWTPLFLSLSLSLSLHIYLSTICSVYITISPLSKFQFLFVKVCLLFVNGLFTCRLHDIQIIAWLALQIVNKFAKYLQWG